MLVGAFYQEKALVWAFSVIVKFVCSSSVVCWREPSQWTLRLRLKCPGSDGAGTIGHWGRRGRDHCQCDAGRGAGTRHGAAVRSHLYLLAASLFSCSNNYIIAALNIWWWLIQNALPDSILTSQSSSVYSLLLSHLWVCASISLSSYPLSIFSRYQTNVSISYSGHVLRFQAVCTNRAEQVILYKCFRISSILCPLSFLTKARNCQWNVWII